MTCNMTVFLENGCIPPLVDRFQNNFSCMVRWWKEITIRELLIARVDTE